MSTEEPTRIRLECTECPFSKVVATDGGRLPADDITRHGRQTGHKLSVTTLGEE